MLMKKDRKIPGSVYKPHSEEIILLQSVALGQPQPSARVFLPYPKYCLKDDPNAEKAEDSKVESGAGKDTSSAMKQNNVTFLKTTHWASKPHLRSF